MRYPKPSHNRKSNRNPIPQSIILQVMERDEGICQYCGKWGRYFTPDTNIHHCVFGGTGRKRIHCIENLITLCINCHGEVHRSKEMRVWTYEWSRKKYGKTVDKLLESKWSGEK